jgi:putative flippase GtrA
MKQFLGYFIVSTLNFIFSSLLFYFLLKIFFINYLLSLSITWILGVVFTYLLNLFFIFKDNVKIDFTNFGRYLIVYLASYIFNIFSLKYITETTFFDPYYIQFFLIPFIILINFFGIKYFALKKI